MFKKIVILASFLAVLPISTVVSFAVAPLQVTANSKNYSASQFTIKDNHVYGNIETISSMMGALNGWVFKDKQSVSFITHFTTEGDSDEFFTWFVKSKNVKIKTEKDKEERTQNITMNNPTVVSKDGEILLPLRDAIVALGKSINWDSKTNKVTVTGKIVY